MGNVPVVEVSDGQTANIRLYVDSSNENPVYNPGDKIRVLCNDHHECIEDTFMGRWSDGLAFLIFLVPLFTILIIRQYLIRIDQLPF